MNAALHKPALDHEATACRKMWCDVVLAVFSDYWTETRKAKGDPVAIARIRAHALRYFRRPYTRDVVLTCAGITAEPERLADLAVDLTAHARTLRGET